MGFEIRKNTSSVVKGAVETFPDLSNIQNPQINDYYLVRKGTGIPFVNRKSSGLYYWNGTEWKDDDQDIINKINTLETTIVANALVVSNHESRQDNPHNVTKSQVGLSNVPNTDATNRSNHTGTQPASTVSGLSTVATSGSYNDLADKPSIPIEETTSTIQTKRPLQTIEGKSLEGTGNIDLNKSDVGLEQVDNTSDLDKPISIATQSALDDKVDDSQVLTDVPAGAVFTDTVYDDTVIQNKVDQEIIDRENVDTTLQSNIDNEASTRATVDTAIQLDLDTHKSDTNNPHQVTFTQAVTQDSGTDITVDEAEELTNGSITELHDHPYRFYTFNKVISSDTVLGANTTTTNVAHNEITFNSPEGGVYEFIWSCIWSYSFGGDNIKIDVLLDGDIIATYEEEPQDVAGTGVQLLNTTGGTSNTSTDQRFNIKDFDVTDLTSGDHTISLQFRSSFNGDVAAIYSSKILVKQINTL